MKPPFRPTGPAAFGAMACALCIGAAAPAWAGAFYIQEQSVKGLGRAYSGEAADTGAESLWWNPASIAGVEGVEVATGAHAVLIDARDDDAGSTISRPFQPTAPVGGQPRAYNPIVFGVVPNTAVAWRINDRIAVGFAVDAPFNFTTKYDPTSFARYDGEKSLLFSIDLQPTVSFRVNRYVDLGVGFDAQYLEATLSNAIPNLSPLLPDGQQKLTGDGWNYGYVVGAQLHPAERISVGVSYRSSIKHDLSGRVTADVLPLTPYAQTLDTAARAAFSTPWIATLGVRWRATDRLTLDAQAQHLGWSEFDRITVSYVGGGSVTPENYRDTTTLALGVEYAVNPQWTMRTGAQYDPTPTNPLTRSVRVPDSDRFLVSIGSTVRPAPRLSLDASVGWIDFFGARVNSNTDALAGTPLVTPVSTQGSVMGSGVLLSAGARMTF